MSSGGDGEVFRGELEGMDNSRGGVGGELRGDRWLDLVIMLFLALMRKEEEN